MIDSDFCSITVLSSVVLHLFIKKKKGGSNPFSWFYDPALVCNLNFKGKNHCTNLWKSDFFQCHDAFIVATWEWWPGVWVLNQFCYLKISYIGVYQGCVLSPCLFNLYAEYIMWNARLDEAQAGIKTAGRNINNLRYADDTTLIAESKEELKSLLTKVRGEWKSWLKTQHSKN